MRYMQSTIVYTIVYTWCASDMGALMVRGSLIGQRERGAGGRVLRQGHGCLQPPSALLPATGFFQNQVGTVLGAPAGRISAPPKSTSILTRQGPGRARGRARRAGAKAKHRAAHPWGWGWRRPARRQQHGASCEVSACADGSAGRGARGDTGRSGAT